MNTLIREVRWTATIILYALAWLLHAQDLKIISMVVGLFGGFFYFRVIWKGGEE